MAPRPRHSTAPNASHGTTASQANRRPAAELPEYQPLSHSLTSDHLRELRDLQRAHKVQPLKDHMSKANELLAHHAGDINERLAERAHRFQRQRARREQKGRQATEAEQREEEAVDEMRESVDGLTKRMEEMTRRTIDGQQAVEDLMESVKGLHAAAVPSMPTARPRRGVPVPPAATENREDEMVLDAGPMPTQPEVEPEPEQTAQPSINDAFLKSYDEKHTRYLSLAHFTRYSQQNAYIGFRRTVHEAQHAEDGVPLPPASRWFTESGEPAPGLVGFTQSFSSTQLANGTNGDQDNNENEINDEEEMIDSDEDIAVARENISTKCPLTLREFVHPVASAKCPHSFERAAILELIASAPPPTPHRGRNRAPAPARGARCPVPGCEKWLLQSDVRDDAHLTRRIRRIQRGRRLQEEEAADEEQEEQEGGGGGRDRGGVAAEKEGMIDLSLLNSDAVVVPFEDVGGGAAAAAAAKRERERSVMQGMGSIGEVEAVPDEADESMEAEGGHEEASDMEEDEDDDGDDDGEETGDEME